MNEINENEYMQDAEGRLIPVKLMGAASGYGRR